MGLMTCPDCQRAVSEHAEKCVHCGAPLETGIKHKIESLKEEKRILEKKLDDEFKNYNEKEREIHAKIYGTPEEQAAAKSADRKGWIITIIITSIILIIHLCNPNWWLLLTLPVGFILIVFGIGGAIDPNSFTSISDVAPDPRNAEFKRLIREAEHILDQSKMPLETRIRAINEELKKYPNT